MRDMNEKNHPQRHLMCSSQKVLVAGNSNFSKTAHLSNTPGVSLYLCFVETSQ